MLLCSFIPLVERRDITLCKYDFADRVSMGSRSPFLFLCSCPFLQPHARRLGGGSQRLLL